VLIRPDDIIHDDASPVRARVLHKAFRGAQILYTLRLDSGGRLIGEACHFIDLASALVGADPVSVHTVGSVKPGQLLMLNDNVCISLRFADGSVASVTYTADGAKAMAKEQVEMFGAECALMREPRGQTECELVRDEQRDRGQEERHGRVRVEGRCHVARQRHHHGQQRQADIEGHRQALADPRLSMSLIRGRRIRPCSSLVRQRRFRHRPSC